MRYRAVKSNKNNDVIAIGSDQNQGMKPYGKEGIWCDFIFTEIPKIDNEVKQIIPEDSFVYLLKVNLIKKTIEAKTVEDIYEEHPEWKPEDK